MRLRIVISGVLLTWFFLGARLVQAAQAADELFVGVAAVDITPKEPIRLHGFGFRRTESEGARQPIFAKALAFGRDQKDVAVLIAVDNLGVSDELVREVGRRLQLKVGLDPLRLTVTATHTHTGPMLSGVAPTIFGMPIVQEQQERIDRYTRDFTDKLAEVALAALKDRKAAKVTWGIGKADLAVNRRTPKGPVDHDLPVLVVKDADDKIRAILFNYACHCVTLSDNKISGDWAGYAQAHIERLFPGAIALCSIGCGADANPRSGVTKDKGEIADQQGAEIATEVQRLLRGHLRSVAGPISIRHERIDLAFDQLPTREQWEAKAKQKDAVGHHARVNLARLDRGEALPVKFSYPIQSWIFGETLAMVNLPGEVVADYSLRLKRELDGRRLWINAYANAAPCYIPSEKVLKEGGYEGGGAMIYYDLPTRLAPGLEQQIVGAVQRQLDKSFKAPVDPKKTQGARQLAPEQSLASMKVRPGLAVELMAAEPLVTSPVAIAFGPEGKLWVAEMYDYPLGLDGKYQPGGRIKALSSTKGGLPYDKATVFLDNIPFPTGVTVWRKGVLVCAAPDILYAEDSDGDGKADIVKTLFTGFGAHNYQARVNSLEYGLDGWVYGSCGIFGGKIKSFNGKTYDLGDRDFRIKPDTGELEPATGRTQQGRVRDDWGNWFGCDNSNICWHYPLADHYLRRNPHLIPPPAAVTVSEGDGNRLFPLADSLQLFKLSGPPGRATAACGLGIYRDDFLGEEFRSNTFTCEPVNRLVTRRILSPKGSTFLGRRADDERQAEFLTAADPWFRPVQARTGPDGCLWIVDMHRAVIEHPRWIPPDELAKLDVRAGFDMGRIYRVRPTNEEPRPRQRLDHLASADLVRALDSPNGCLRDLAHQMLIWRNETTSLAALANLFSNAQRPEGRLHALCAHREMSPLPRSLVETASVDKHPGVRRWAVHFSEPLLKNARYDDKTDLPMATPLFDVDAQVRLEAAYLLASSNRPVLAGRALAGVVLRHKDDVYLTAAALSSVTKENASAFVHGLVDGQPAMKLPVANMQKIVSAAIGVADRSSLTAIFDTLLISSSMNEASSYAVLGAFLESLERRALKLDQIADGASKRKWTNIEQRARAIAASPKESDEARAQALSVLGLSSEQKDADRKLFANLLAPQAGPRLQTAALDRLSGLGDEAAANDMIAGWKSHSPALRGQVLDALLSRPAWQKLLLGAIDKKAIPANDIDAARRERLLNHRDASLRQQSAKAFAGTLNTDRQKVLDSHRDVLRLTGDSLRGKAVFAQHCAACHALDGVGHSVGPDLAALAGKSPEYFLQEILDPSRNLDSRFVQYLAVTKNGQIFSGLMASESAVSITLKGPDGKESSVLRADLEELTTAGKSLMPDGLEMNLTKQALADLLAYLTSPRTTR